MTGRIAPDVYRGAAGPTQPAVAGQPALHRTFRDVLAAIDRSSTAAPAAAPGHVGAPQALALQAEVYRHAERVELVSRLLDHAVGAVKTLLQTRF